MGAAKKMDRTMEWFSRANLRKYRGQYVAIVGRRVVASGRNAKKVLGEAHRRYPGKEAVLWKEPKEDILLL